MSRSRIDATTEKRSPVMLPIPGTSSIDHLESNTAAAGIEPTDDELEALSKAV